MEKLRKPNVEQLENMECYYSYYYENPQYYDTDAYNEMESTWTAIKTAIDRLSAQM